MTERKTLGVLIAVFAALLFIERPASWLCDPDESRYAEIPQRMLLTGDYLTPELNGSHYFEKPPLLYWANAASMKLFGDTPYAARLPVRCAAIGTALLLLWLLKKTKPTTRLWAALIFLSSTLPFVLGRINLTDGFVSFGLTLTLSMRNFLIARDNNESETEPLSSDWVLSKGVIGILSNILFLWCAITREWKRIGELIFSWATPLVVILATPWFAVPLDGKAAISACDSQFFFIHEHLMRFATSANRASFLLPFFTPFIAGFLPWTPMLVNACRPLFSRPVERFSANRDALFFALWAVVIVAFFSLSHSKLIPYILPAFPATAALVALNAPDIKSKKLIWTMTAWALLYAGLIVAQPAICEQRSLHTLAVAAQQTQAEQIVAFHTFTHTFPLVLKHPIPVVDYHGELASDGIKNPELFWTKQKFWETWNSSRTVVAVFYKTERPLFDAQPNKPYIIKESRKCTLAANSPAPSHDNVS